MDCFPTTPSRPGGKGLPATVARSQHESGRQPSDPVADRDYRHDFARGPQILLDANELADGADYLELGLTAAEPRRAPAGLLRGLGRRRGLPAAVPGPRRPGADLRRRGAAQLLRRRLERRLGGTSSTPSTTSLPAVPGVAARSSGTAVDEDVLVLEEPDERFELQRPRQPLRRAGRDLGRVAATPREVWVVDAATRPSSAALGGRAPARGGVPRRARRATRRLATSCSSSPTTTPTEFRLARRPVPRDGRPGPHGLGAGAARGPGRAARAGRRLRRRTSCCSLRAGGAATGCGVARRSTTSPGPASSSHPPLPGRHASSSRTTRCFDAALGHGRRRSRYVHPLVWSDVDLATGERTERHRQEAPGHDPDDVRLRARTFPSPDGTTVPATVVRRRDTPLDGTAPALLYGYGAYESLVRARVGPGAAAACSTAVSSSSTPTSAAAVRAAAAGGSTAGWSTSRTPSPTTSRWPTGSPATGLVDGARLATRGLSAGGLLQGAVFSQRPDRWRAVVAEVPVRRRGDHDVRRRRSRSPSTSGTSGATRAARRSSAGCSPTRRTTTCRPPARGPTCWSPAPCTTRG